MLFSFSYTQSIIKTAVAQSRTNVTSQNQCRLPQRSKGEFVFLKENNLSLLHDQTYILECKYRANTVLTTITIYPNLTFATTAKF